MDQVTANQIVMVISAAAVCITFAIGFVAGNTR